MWTISQGKELGLDFPALVALGGSDEEVGLSVLVGYAPGSVFLVACGSRTV